MSSILTIMASALFLDIFHPGMTKDEANAALNAFMQALSILPYLTTVKARMSSWDRKRPMPLAKVICATWVTKPALKTEGRYIVANPSRFYETHLEVAVPIGKSTVALYVMYEPVPFIHQSRFRVLADPETVSQFQARRKQLQEAFAQECSLLTAEGRLPKVTVTKHNTMIGKVEFNVTNMTVEQVSMLVGAAIDDVGSALTGSLHEVDELRRAQAETRVLPAESINLQGVSAGEEVVAVEQAELVISQKATEEGEETALPAADESPAQEIAEPSSRQETAEEETGALTNDQAASPEQLVTDRTDTEETSVTAEVPTSQETTEEGEDHLGEDHSEPFNLPVIGTPNLRESSEEGGEEVAGGEVESPSQPVTDPPQ
jgi:hypothetical protein